MAKALAPEQRLAIYDRHLAGEPLGDIARDLGVHYETARKWWREGRIKGRAHLGQRPRKRIGLLRKVAPEAIALIQRLRKRHPSWGLPYLRAQVLAHPDLTDEQRATVPSTSTFYRYIHDLEGTPPRVSLRNRAPSQRLVKQAQYPHHLWQMDLKEKCKVAGLRSQITVATVRDIYSSVTVGASIFELKRPNATLSCADMRAACRACFSDWGLPDILRTDKGTCFIGNMHQHGFPSVFTLWLVGLGVAHETIEKGKVTQNGCVERFNRTYNDLVLRDGPFANTAELEQVSQTTVEFLNNKYPSNAGSCDRQAPLEAHPEAATPRRGYETTAEEKLFSLERVDAYLSKFRWQRRADSVGKLSIANCDYYVGRQHKGCVFDIRFDPKDRCFVLKTPDGTVTLRQPALGLEADDIRNTKRTAPEPVRLSDSGPPLRAYDK